MKGNLSKITKFASVALLILSALYANNEDEKKTPEVLQNILDGFASETMEGHYTILNPLLGEIQIFENSRGENGENVSTEIDQISLVDDSQRNSMTELAFADHVLKNFIANSVFWIDIRNGQVNLNLFNPEDEQVYNFNVNMPEGLVLDTNASYTVELSIQGDDLRGMSIQSRAQNDPDQTIVESYFINLETLELENYYDYSEVLESLQEEMGNFTITRTFFRPNGLIYMNAFQSNFTGPVESKMGVIIDPNTNEYRFFPGLFFLDTTNINGHEVLIYETVYVGDGVQRFYGVRDLTSNKDLWFRESIEGSYTFLWTMGDLHYLQNGSSGIHNTVLPIYHDDGEIVVEEWSVSDVGLVIFEDASTGEVGVNLFSPELIERYNLEGIQTSFRYPVSLDSDNLHATWNQIYNHMAESLASIGLELRREQIEVLHDELLLEEPR